MLTITFPPLFESSLVRAFMQDHQRLTRGLARLAAAVEKNDAADARRIADEIDRLAGGHMEFEESILYPRVSRVFGPGYAAQLYAEHRVGQSAVRRLLRLREGEWLLPREREMMLEDLRSTSEHVLSCGTLLSVLADLPEPEQAQLLERLERYRAAARRWSRLPPPPQSGEMGDVEGAETA